jgi:hypothetical protein
MDRFKKYEEEVFRNKQRGLNMKTLSKLSNILLVGMLVLLLVAGCAQESAKTVAATPEKRSAEDKIRYNRPLDASFVSQEFGFSVAYPKHYVVEKDLDEPFVFQAASPKKVPVLTAAISDPGPITEAIEDIITEAAGSDIQVKSQRETTLKDGNTKATEYIIEYLAMGQWELKGIGLIVIKDDTLILYQVTSMITGFEKWQPWFETLLYSIKVQ